MHIPLAQIWSDLLFAHWPVPKEQLLPWIPASLELDEFHGGVWIAAVPFRMSAIRISGTPALPYLSQTLELNLRTYVRQRGQPDSKPGVFFFTLDAANPVAVRIARRFFHLPYFHARISCETGDGWLHFQSRRTHKGVPGAEFGCRYRPSGPISPALPSTLDYFLTERYCFYTTDSHGNLFRGDIQHTPWPLQPAEAEFLKNGLTLPWGIVLPQTPPLLHFARRLDIATNGLERLDAHRRI